MIYLRDGRADRWNYFGGIESPAFLGVRLRSGIIKLILIIGINLVFKSKYNNNS